MVRPIKDWGRIKKYKCILKCPECGCKQAYIPRNKVVFKKKKKCIRCGKMFDVVKHLIKEADWGERV